MLSNNYYNKLVDICCSVVSTDGEVTLEERIWMNKLCEHNAQAKSIAEQLLCPNTVGEDVAYYQ